GTSVTTGPELQSAVVTAGPSASGTIVRYCFDELVALLGAPGGYKLYNALALLTNGTATSLDLTGKCVNVTFPITSAAALALNTVATVVEGVVNGTGGSLSDKNPEGNVPFGRSSTTALQAGDTS